MGVMRPTEPAERNPVQKALQILSWMVDAPRNELGVREVAAGLGFALGTTHRLLANLESNAFVTRTRNGKYSPGLELLRISSALKDRLSVLDVARPELRELVDECNETAFFGLYDSTRGEMVFAIAVESEHPLRYVVELHRWMPIHAGASGLAILAFLPAEERRRILRRNLGRLTERTVIDPGQIEQEAIQVRERGYAMSRGQRTVGAVGIAAPVFGREAKVVGDVLVTIPEHRFQPGSERQLSHLVKATAGRISEQLGASRGQ